ncbi:MAG: toprim domain-containing protein [Nitrososphaerota archaeon]
MGHLDSTLEAVRAALEKLCREDESAVVLVEGPRDEKSLRAVGFGGRVVHLRALRELVDTLPSSAKVILLLDFDREGRAMTKKVAKMLASEHVKVDLYYYRELSSVKRLGVNTVQDLVSLLEG